MSRKGDKHGTPNERFIGKYRVNQASGCWEWVASTVRRGYGVFRLSSDRHVSAHRASWEIFNGPIPAGLFVCHHCDNRKCVNPSHLYLGNHDENMRDARLRGRMARGSRNGNSALTEAQVLRIRGLAHLPRRDVAKMFGVGVGTIQRVVSKQVFAHV